MDGYIFLRKMICAEALVSELPDAFRLDCEPCSCEARGRLERTSIPVTQKGHRDGLGWMEAFCDAKRATARLLLASRQRLLPCLRTMFYFRKAKIKWSNPCDGFSPMARLLPTPYASICEPPNADNGLGLDYELYLCCS